MVILASDYTGLVELLLWWGVNGFYFVMLLITAIGCIGRRHSRTADNLTRSLVLGGIALFFSLALVGWCLLGRSHPEWREFRFYAVTSTALWVAALLLRRYQQRLSR